MRSYFLNFRAIRNDAGQSGDNGGTGTPQTFTQEQVNAFLAAERKKDEVRYKKQQDETLAQLNQLKQSKGLTEQEKSDLEQRIELLTNQNLTEKQQLENQLKKTKTESETTVKTLSSERDTWKSQYDTMLIKAALTTAAVKGEAYSPEQIQQVLGGRAKVVPVLDGDGKIIPAEFKVVVEWSETDNKGNSVKLELPAEEVVKKMKEDTDRFGNLFKSGAVGGTGTVGGSAAGRKGTIDPSKLDYKAYVKARKEGLI